MKPTPSVDWVRLTAWPTLDACDLGTSLTEAVIVRAPSVHGMVIPIISGLGTYRGVSGLTVAAEGPDPLGVLS